VPVFTEKRVSLERFRAGDRAALAEVYRFYFQDILQLARRGFVTRGGVRALGIGRAADRLDFVQDVFVKAFADAARYGYDGLRPYRPFLLQIARNLRVDQLRQAGRDPSLVVLAARFRWNQDFDDPPDRPGESSAAEATETDLHWQRLVSETVGFLGSLETEVQTIARLRFVEDLSQADVAERLGITRRRVRTLEGRLLGGARRHLSKSGLVRA